MEGRKEKKRGRKEGEENTFNQSIFIYIASNHNKNDFKALNI